MFEAVPKTWLSWDYSVVDGSTTIADMDLSLWREKGQVTTRNEVYSVYREGLVQGDFVLELGGTILARAEKPSALRRSFTIDYEEQQYTLEAASALGRRFILLDGSYEIGSITPTCFLTRRGRVDLPEDMPLSLTIFIIWLTLIMWKREASSS